MTHSQTLLMGGEDSSYHDFDLLLPILEEQLAKQDLKVTSSQDPDHFLPENIHPYHLIVCYTFGHTLTQEQEKGLLHALRGDPWDEKLKTKGLIGIHGATCSFLNSEPYLRMLGGKFLSHPPIDRLEVKINQPEHPVMHGASDFSIQDELYLIDPYSPFEILASCHYQGFPRPVVWVKPYGLGIVCYLSLGHGPDQLQHPAVESILQNAVRWILSS